jgi:hypothetical protein
MSRRTFLLGMACGSAVTAVAAFFLRHSISVSPVATPVAKVFIDHSGTKPFAHGLDSPFFNAPEIPLREKPLSEVPALPPGATPHNFNGQTFYLVPIQSVAMR